MVIFHSNIYLAFFFFTPFFDCILSIGKSIAFGKWAEELILLLPREMWPFVCFLFFWTCLGKHKFFFFSQSVVMTSPQERYILVLPFVCTAANEPAHFLCCIMKCNLLKLCIKKKKSQKCIHLSISFLFSFKLDCIDGHPLDLPFCPASPVQGDYARNKACRSNCWCLPLCAFSPLE